MAVVKDAAFYRKQRERDKAAAEKGDPKAKKELAQIEAKRRGKGAPTKTYTVDGKTVRAVSRAAALKQGGKSNGNGKPKSTSSNYPDRSLRGVEAVARKAGAGSGPLPGLIKKGVEAVGKRAQAGDVAMARAAGAVKSGIGTVQKAKQAGEARQGQQAASIRGAIGKSLPKPDPDVGIAGMLKRSQS